MKPSTSGIQKQQDNIYVPVDMFVRISRREKEPNERALLVARRRDGKGEFIFSYYDSFQDIDNDLTVCDFTPSK